MSTYAIYLYYLLSPFYMSFLAFFLLFFHYCLNLSEKKKRMKNKIEQKKQMFDFILLVAPACIKRG